MARKKVKLTPKRGRPPKGAFPVVIDAARQTQRRIEGTWGPLEKLVGEVQKRLPG